MKGNIAVNTNVKANAVNARVVARPYPYPYYPASGGVNACVCKELDF